MNWKSDPELKKMREEFIASLHDRRLHLSPVLRELKIGGKHCAQATEALKSSAHKLAGVSESYGFPVLGSIAHTLEAVIEKGTISADPAKLATFGALLDEAMKLIVGQNEDSTALLQDARMAEMLTIRK